MVGTGGRPGWRRERRCSNTAENRRGKKKNPFISSSVDVKGVGGGVWGRLMLIVFRPSRLETFLLSLRSSG